MRAFSPAVRKILSLAALFLVAVSAPVLLPGASAVNCT